MEEILFWVFMALLGTLLSVSFLRAVRNILRSEIVEVEIVGFRLHRLPHAFRKFGVPVILPVVRFQNGREEEQKADFADPVFMPEGHKMKILITERGGKFHCLSLSDTFWAIWFFIFAIVAAILLIFAPKVLLFWMSAGFIFTVLCPELLKAYFFRTSFLRSSGNKPKKPDLPVDEKEFSACLSRLDTIHSYKEACRLEYCRLNNWRLWVFLIGWLALSLSISVYLSIEV